ncbi:MAG: pseudouridine-5'-phosphate glycosidase [Deinococcales bacterium]
MRDLIFAPEVAKALDQKQAVVALESTVISHGLPYPDNYDTALACERVVREAGAIPATIALIKGQVHIGLTQDELYYLATTPKLRKISRRNFGIALAGGESGGTTVSGTLIAAHHAGIRIFATGGIGGVHRGEGMDISADLLSLAQTPVAVVCAGAKAILDLPRTLEYLETVGVPVLGYQTSYLPEFYTVGGRWGLELSLNTPQDLAKVLKAHWNFGILGGLLIAVNPPAELALSHDEVESYINTALAEAEHQGIQGVAVTPFLLQRVSELSQGKTKTVNKALLINNAHLAAHIALALVTL